ncbi:polysaccharide biosynthesis C-terminal domain-containing protein [uncultured Rikenella sp.]|mgnify:FL=1|uniref:oligosaccharide flippase family protein n=1 Tax=uncultured Rikenella sp. TaxID=368003 RepID=UPI0025CDD1B1|nr:polysaccharide biosynthesis C-terminal domain-containing protein [uncultured Rikenella sp.]
MAAAHILRKLASQTAVYGVSAILSKFLNYLLTPYLTRILTEQVYGQVNLLYGIIPFANVVLTMGLATGYFRYAAKCQTPGEKRRLFTTTWGAVTLMASLFGVIMAACNGALAGVMRLDPACIAAMTALIVVDNVAAIPLAALREERKAVYYTIVNVTGVGVNVAACVLLYSYVPGATESPLWVVVANLIASTVSLLLLLPHSIRLLSRAFSLPLLRSIFAYSIPLMMAGIMGVAGDFIDRQLIYFMLPAEIADAELGVYTAVAKIAALLMIFRQIYTLGAEPFFLQGFSKEDFRTTNAEATKYFTIAGIAIFLVLALFAREFAYIVGSDFRSGMGVLPLLLLANLLAGILVNLSFWYKAADKTRVAIYITGSGVAVTLVLNLLLIPSMGYHGAAVARVVSMLAMVTASYLLCRKYFPVPFDLRRIGFYFLLGGAIFGLSYATALLPDGGRVTLNFLLLLIYLLVACKVELGGRKIGTLWKK